MVTIWNTKLYVWLNYTDQFQGFFLIFAAIILLLFYLFIYFLLFSPQFWPLYYAEITMFCSSSEQKSDGCHVERIVAACVMLVKEAMPGFYAPLW